MTKEQQDDVARALAIYRGLPDSERQDRLDAVRRAKYYSTDMRGNVYDPDIRTFAVILLPYIEQAERDIQRERAEVVRLEVERQLRAMSVRHTHDFQPVQTPMSGIGVRALGAFAVIGLGVYGAYLFIAFLVESGILLWAFIGLMAIAFFSALPRPGSTSIDDEKKTEATTGTQNIHINITGHGGQIHVTQGGQ